MMERYRLMDDGFEVEAKLIYFDWNIYDYNELKYIPYNLFNYYNSREITNLTSSFNIHKQ